MKKTKYDILKKRCMRAESNLTMATERMALELQPYFNEEINVLYQISDGFVVLLVHSEGADNLPIDEVFKTINKHPRFYLD